ncbi:Responsible for the deiodination of T4 (3,5,3',5'- tetraiodothyronine) [Branchiostoma belcheri]|nr:Responsible for the deiodination of T4 (3,5,3',5'- tetraiodothyronine) [Branchiostoma belcheri]
MAAPGFFRTLFSYLWFLVKWTVQMIFLRILGVVSPARQRDILVRVAKATQFWDCPLEFDDYADTFLSLSAYLDVCGAVWRDVTSYVTVGSPAPRCDVIELDTGRTRDLLEFGNPAEGPGPRASGAGRPSPGAELRQLLLTAVPGQTGRLQAPRSGQQANCRLPHGKDIVYLAEAHPPGGWALKNNITIPQHRSLQERLAAARKLQQLDDDNVPCCPIVVDTMDNNVARAYACYPDRLFVILDGIVVYKGGLGPEGYHLDEVRDWLQNFTGKDRQR